IVALALTSTAWGFGLRTVYLSDENAITKGFDLAYPVADILIGTVLILAIRRATHQQQGRMALLLGGVAAYSVADRAFCYLTALVESAPCPPGPGAGPGWQGESLRRLGQGLKTALVGIRSLSESVRVAPKLDIDGVRRVAADIDRDAQRLDRLVDEMLELES